MIFTEIEVLSRYVSVYVKYKIKYISVAIILLCLQLVKYMSLELYSDRISCNDKNVLCFLI